MKAVTKGIIAIKKYQKISDFFGKKTETDIALVEKHLKINLPMSYKKFLQDFGCGNIGSIEIYGLLATDYTSPASYVMPDILYIHKSFRKNFDLPHHIILISDIGDGSYYALDLSQMNEEQECPVVIWPVGGYDETPELEIVAPDFGTWFLEQVEEQIKRHKK